MLPGGLYAVKNTDASYAKALEWRKKRYQERVTAWLFEITKDGPIILNFNQFTEKTGVKQQSARKWVKELQKLELIFVNEETFRIDGKRRSVKVLRRIDQQSMSIDINLIKTLGRVHGRYDKDWRAKPDYARDCFEQKVKKRHIEFIDKLFQDHENVIFNYQWLKAKTGKCFKTLQKIIISNLESGILRMEAKQVDGKFVTCLIKDSKNVIRDTPVPENKVHFESHVFKGTEAKPTSSLYS